MIQRIQSVYLTIGLILMAMLGWLPLGEILSGENVYTFTIAGVQNSQTQATLYSGLPLIVFLSIIGLIQLLIIFSYKKRVRQMRMASFNIILMLGLLFVGWYFVHQSIKLLGSGTYAYQLPVVFPFIAAVLNYLAIRAIGRDEALVRSVDRIR